MLSSIVDGITGLHGPVLYLLVGLLVFGEDALFVGFVIPGETAAVVGGVAANRGNASLTLMIVVVVLAAVIGDSVGYEVGRHIGPRILDLRILRKRRRRLDDARDFLKRRGGWAVFLGRFIAFFRAVMPALAGTSKMRYRRFLTFNAMGGIAWGIGFVLLGWAAGSSYKKIEGTVGRTVAYVVVGLVVVGFIVWRVYRHRSESNEESDSESAQESA